MFGYQFLFQITLILPSQSLAVVVGLRNVGDISPCTNIGSRAVFLGNTCFVRSVSRTTQAYPWQAHRACGELPNGRPAYVRSKQMAQAVSTLPASPVLYLTSVVSLGANFGAYQTAIWGPYDRLSATHFAVPNAVLRISINSFHSTYYRAQYHSYGGDRAPLPSTHPRYHICEYRLALATPFSRNVRGYRFTNTMVYEQINGTTSAFQCAHECDRLMICASIAFMKASKSCQISYMDSSDALFMSYAAVDVDAEIWDKL